MATLSSLIERVQNDLDLQDEDQIEVSEITEHINSGIRAAEKLIHTLYEDYFLAPPHTVSLVSGTSQYDLPTDIFAQKIRRVIYNNGSKKRLIRRVRRLEDTILLDAGDDFEYMITNDPVSGLKINFYPLPQETGAFVSVWYIRQANELSGLTDVLELPEAEDYIVQYAKDKCINKERWQMDAAPSAALMREEQLLTETLANRFPDEDNEIEPDLWFYGEHT